MPGADKQIIRERIGKTSLPQLTAALKDQLKVTKDHVRKLETMFKCIGIASQSTPHREVARVLEEGGESIGAAEGPVLIDAIIIAAAEKVERYEINSYGTLCAWAKTLGEEEADAIQHDVLGRCST